MKEKINLKEMCLMDLMVNLASVSEGQGAPKTIVSKKEIAIYASELGNRLNFTPLQALLLTQFVNLYPDCSISTKDLSRHLSCTNLAILACYEDIKVLRERRYIAEYKERDNIAYYVPINVIIALRENHVLKPKDYSNMSGDEMMDELISTLNAFRREDIDYVDALNTSSEIVAANPHLSFCRQINEYGLKDEDWLLLLHVCCAYYRNRQSKLDLDDIHEFLSSRAGFKQARLFRENKHILLTKGILEPAGDELASENEWCLSHRVAKELMGELCPNIMESSKRDVLNADGIGAKALFYPVKTARQVSELEKLLSPEEFSRVQDSLEAHGMRKGFACLFYGTPGTGKTETVLQLARKTGRNIMQVDMSQMRDKYVGESEKNVKQIFTRYRQLCRESDLTPILLLNEADALLGVRLSKVEHSVDQMANTMQNILLQEMENLDGILIATTNLTQNLDSAFDRRFLYKVEFLKPTAEESRHIWKAMLPEISEDDALMLAKQYAFSGGQIENIARKQIVNAILFPSEGRDLNKIRQACDSEYLNKKQTRPIGFC